jgi:hypothetical protein
MATCTFGQQLLLDRATELVAPELRSRFRARINRAGGRGGAPWETDQLVRVVNMTLLEFLCEAGAGWRPGR